MDMHYPVLPNLYSTEKTIMTEDLNQAIQSAVEEFLSENYENPTAMDRLIIENAMKKASLVTVQVIHVINNRSTI